jgi:hypothetical protein
MKRLMVVRREAAVRPRGHHVSRSRPRLARRALLLRMEPSYGSRWKIRRSRLTIWRQRARQMAFGGNWMRSQVDSEAEVRRLTTTWETALDRSPEDLGTGLVRPRLPVRPTRLGRVRSSEQLGLASAALLEPRNLSWQMKSSLTSHVHQLSEKNSIREAAVNLNQRNSGKS